MTGPYHLVQPWGKDRGREATVLGTYGSCKEAFAALDAMRERMRQVGSSPDCIELVVVDFERHVVNRADERVPVERLPVFEGPRHRSMSRVTKRS